MGEPLRRTISSTPNSEVTLAAQNVSGQAQEAHDAVKKVAEDLEASPLQVALAWLLKRSKVILPIPGTSSIKHLEENIAAASLELPQAAYDELSEVSLPAASLRG
jgi:pyridoxine 4-dehydrogenase